jgi:DNA-binding CsgD family transcriptional regulator
MLLDAVAREYSKASVTAVRGASDGDRWLDRLTGDSPVLIDDAHRLPEKMLQRLRTLTESDTARLVVAYRPWPRPPGLSALGAGLSRRHSPVMVGHLDRSATAARITRRLDCTPGDPLIDLVHEQAGGLPWLADLVTQALLDTGRFNPRHPEQFRRPQRVSISPALAERLRYHLEALDPRVYELLQAMAVGAALDAEILASLLDADPVDVTETVEAARATGLLTEAGELITFIRNLVLRLMPMLHRRKMQRQLAEIQLERGGSVLAAGRALLGTGATGSRVATVLEAAGDEALRSFPEIAGELFAGTVDAGGSARELAARRAQAAALAGDLDEALRLADETLSDPEAPDRTRGISVAAAVLAQRGLLARSAQLYRGIPGNAALAVPALIGIGALAEARSALADSASHGHDATSLLAGAGTLMATGMLATVEDNHTTALSQLARATALLEPAGETVLLPDTPAALSAVVALQCGELTVADSVLRQAVATKLGGRPAHTRHLLLHGWIAMVRGAFDVAHRALKLSRGRQASLEPRDELLASALATGLARRESDPAALRLQVRRARTALVRHSIDLYALQPLGELAVAAAECAEQDWIVPHLEEAETLLRKLGDPPLWAAPLHWYRLHAAFVASDPTAAEEHAAALADAAPSSPYVAALAEAGKSWVATMHGDIDPDTVQAAARRLHGVGLAAEGARLAGQAAAATADRKAMTALLACARALHERAAAPPDRNPAPEPGAADTACPPGEDSETSDVPDPTPSDRLRASRRLDGDDSANNPGAGRAILSGRELEVGRLILAGLTYKNIGERLFISAKTVEHHVARMRQRLGAGDRTELFARLRSLVGEGNAVR